eukprot:NODE_158_length_15065_cov_0.349125.p13 type:complete len:127 gc:universal NODE_158_length_15065_cov_0.349125:5735-5355(-)
MLILQSRMLINTFIFGSKKQRLSFHPSRSDERSWSFQLVDTTRKTVTEKNSLTMENLIKETSQFAKNLFYVQVVHQSKYLIDLTHEDEITGQKKTWNQVIKQLIVDLDQYRIDHPRYYELLKSGRL